MNSNGSGRKSEGFFTGKGFYIVLFLCAAVIGVSAWMIAAGNKTMLKETNEANIMPDNRRVETVIIPPPREEAQPVINTEEIIVEEATEVNTDGLTENEVQEEAVEVWVEEEAEGAVSTAYVWPVNGELERTHDTENLSYDVTMKDWRTHEGIDILSPLGSTVTAAHAGSVSSIVNDDLYGTTVTIDHGDGTVSVYSNLEELTAVSVGDFVEPGTVIGSIGATAICESGQCSHLHYAILVNGESRDPLDFLPA